MLRSLLERASSSGAVSSGILGVRALPEWDGPGSFSHHGVIAHVRPCISPLAMRQAIRQRASDDWLIVLTDCDESDLGVGLTRYLNGQRLRTPDPWDAVRTLFRAPRLDRRLVAGPRARDLALGLASVAQELDLPPAPAGMLTLDHVCGSLCERVLALRGAQSLSLEDVMDWSADARAVANIATLRERAGEVLTALVLRWIAARCGAAGPAVSALLESDRASSLAPLGLVARPVRESRNDVPRALLTRVHLSGTQVSEAGLDELASAAESVALRRLHRRDKQSAIDLSRLLRDADALATDISLGDDVAASTLLPSALERRLEHLGRALQLATERSRKAVLADPRGVSIPSEAAVSIEEAFTSVEEHAAAGTAATQRVRTARAGVRLVRWLAQPAPDFQDLADATRDYRDALGWVDRAYADAWRGVDGLPELASGLRAVVETTKARRAVSDSRFGALLASHAALDEALPSDVVRIEDLIPTVVAPLARGGRPVLLVVADGMSVPVATEIVDSLQLDSGLWHECLPDDQERRSTALAVLPSLTEVSRCSMLSGHLATGGQSAERSGFAELLRAQNLTGTLLHKKSLASSGGGESLPGDVAQAIDDTAQNQVVACVLNSIDDALDRTDPGIDWDTDAVQHLRPLLESAQRAGRVVVLTSDHGHVIERRAGHVLEAGTVSSNRSRPGGLPPEVTAEEVRVRGPRVLLHDGDAVLAVDESLRYGSLKAGYHGGAAPAEVVIPIHVLAVDPPRRWREAAPQEPLWWRESIQVAADPTAAIRETPPARKKEERGDQPTLFDTGAEQAPKRQETPPSWDLAARVAQSPVYRDQLSRAGRLPIDEARILTLLRALAHAPSHRVSIQTAASLLNIATVRVSGALPYVQRLLNIDQYAVISRDDDDIVLDLDLLREQFEVKA
ncbi:BREX-2 system phosphatase PglZ [Demequina muriae]|uniref:BREX-2 system phosphatase PglZ n=1 Tax=Demequina muriae TaxID=3051664 RepID=A0ABT8GE61_9MICO|nr:BREX-2 system phosphatase PglZ [Demequina sp. EGI L300058]MDN4479713.1 BREX-2 system phosphatase PglZ [Demequina sp. EGI L300058]